MRALKTWEKVALGGVGIGVVGGIIYLVTRPKALSTTAIAKGMTSGGASGGISGGGSQASTPTPPNE